MRKIKVTLLFGVALLLGFYGNVYAVPSNGCDCSSCHTGTGGMSSRPSQCVPEPVNSVPVANAGTDQTVDEGSSVALNGANSTDPDNNIAFYFWEQIAGPAVTLSDVAAVRPSFTAPAVGINGAALTFRLTVTDDAGASSTDTCIVNVSWVNESPTADAGSDQTVDEGIVVTLDGSNSSDPDDGIASYSWREVGPSSVTLSGGNSARPTFTAPVVLQNSMSLTFELTVTDNGGLQSTDTCIVNVNAVDNTPANQSPTADAGTDQTVAAGDVVTLDASNSSDPDDGIASYLWTQVGMTSGSSVTLSDPTAVKPTFDAPAAGPASLTFQVTVTDNGGLQSTDTCIVNVNAVDNPPANQMPIADAGPDQTVATGDVVTLDASNSGDPDGAVVSCIWKQTGGTSVTLSNPAAVKPSFKAPATRHERASLTFKVTIMDDGGLQSTDTCVVKVKSQASGDDDHKGHYDEGDGDDYKGHHEDGYYDGSNREHDRDDD